MRLAQKTELRIAGSVRQGRSTQPAMRCVVAVPGLEPGEEGYTHRGCPGRLTSATGPVPASWGVAGLDLACLCRRPGQLHLSLVRTRRAKREHASPASRTAASLVELATSPGSASPWSSLPPTAGSPPAPRPRPPRSSGRCRPRPSSSAAGADPRPRPGCPWARDSAACSAWSRHTTTASSGSGGRHISPTRSFAGPAYRSHDPSTRHPSPFIRLGVVASAATSAILRQRPR